MRKILMLASVTTLLVAGCATTPSGPEVLVLPGTGKSFDEFRVDDLVCRDHALQQIGGKAGAEAANQKVIGSAAIGTAVGAVAGAAIGGRDGAGVGAGMGMVIGAASGADAARGSEFGSQRRYDHAYVQCMYAKGHRVPVNGQYMLSPTAAQAAPAMQPPPPPPPAGSPPPPPPR